MKPTYSGWQNTTRVLACTNKYPPTAICELVHTTRWCAFRKWDDPLNEGRITGWSPQGRIQGNLTSTTLYPSNEFISPDPTEFSYTANSIGPPPTWRLIQNDGPFISTSWMVNNNPRYVPTTVRFGLQNLATLPQYNGTFKIKIADMKYALPSLTSYQPDWDPSGIYNYNRQQYWYYKD